MKSCAKPAVDKVLPFEGFQTRDPGGGEADVESLRLQRLSERYRV